MMAEEWNHGGRMFNPESPSSGNQPIALAAVLAATAMAALMWGRNRQKAGGA